VDIDAARGLVRVGLHASPRVGPSLMSLDDDCVLASFDLGGNPLDDRSFPVPRTFQSGPFPALGPYALGADGTLRVDSYAIEKDWLPVGNRAVRSWWPGSFPLDGSVQRADFGDDTREERDTVAIGADGTTTWAGSRADGFTFAGQRIEAPTPKFAFIANLDTQGKPRWHATVRAFDKGVPAFFPTLARDVDGSSYLSALFDEDPVQLDPSYVGPVVPPDRQYSWLLRKYGPQGELMWEKFGAVAGTSKGLTTLLSAAGGALAIALVNVDLVDLGKERVQADGSTLLLELDTNGELRRTQKLEDGVSALSLNAAGELVIAGQSASTGGDYDLFVTKFAR
jgi:hypothetical protein